MISSHIHQRLSLAHRCILLLLPFLSLRETHSSTPDAPDYPLITRVDISDTPDPAQATQPLPARHFPCWWDEATFQRLGKQTTHGPQAGRGGGERLWSTESRAEGKTVCLQWEGRGLFKRKHGKEKGKKSNNWSGTRWPGLSWECSPARESRHLHDLLPRRTPSGSQEGRTAVSSTFLG